MLIHKCGLVRRVNVGLVHVLNKLPAEEDEEEEEEIEEEDEEEEAEEEEF
jgi:hypothetical protein